MSDEYIIKLMGGLWTPTPVTAAPEVVLIRWSIMQTHSTRHFVGYNYAEREGRVSSRIVEFDAARMCGVTESGRVYQLKGQSSRDSDAEYVRRAWLRINEIAEDGWRDITDEILRLTGDSNPLP